MNVLVGVGSPNASPAAIERTIRRAARVSDELTVAICSPETATDESLEATVTATLDDYDIAASTRHVEGQPGSELVDIAETEGFDEIVLAGGQTSPMGKITIDKTVEFVVLNAHTTVTLVR
ncbi:universal stress protein [Halonotius sp. F2-221B]|uniref:universal stress protein n=1 Tax=Halonotius sp. F2-221B TaxID=2731620 RepID=UPI00398B9762